MAIYLVVGITKDPTRVWPVSFDVDKAVCEKKVIICKAEAKDFVEALKPIWAAMEALVEPNEWSRAGWRAGRAPTQVRNKNFNHERSIYEAQRNKLECDEHELNIKHRDNMLDPLFPTGNDGWCPEVDYQIWTVYEDIRNELNAAELMLVRAKLHANEEADSTYAEDDDDES